MTGGASASAESRAGFIAGISRREGIHPCIECRELHASNLGAGRSGMWKFSSTVLQYYCIRIEISENCRADQFNLQETCTSERINASLQRYRLHLEFEALTI